MHSQFRIMGILLSLAGVAGCSALNRPSNGATTPARISAPQQTGTILHGTLATRYDRDGDGQFEEARRAGVTYYDRNQDGVADLVVTGSHPISEYQWDSEFDGILDSAITCEAGAAPVWSSKRKIARPGARIFLDDRPLSAEATPPGSRGYAGVIKHLNLPTTP